MFGPDASCRAVTVAVAQALEGFGKKLMWRRLQRQYGLDDESGVPPPPEGDDDAPGGGRGQDARNAPSGGLSGLAAMDAAGDMGAGGSGRYMPPSARGGAAGGAGGASLEDRFSEDRDHATLRVTNISEDTTEADLQVILSPRAARPSRVVRRHRSTAGSAVSRALVRRTPTRRRVRSSVFVCLCWCSAHRGARGERTAASERVA